ncbi:MAG: bifunctional folylpolyglutamate synthase/dihydrofolate synthase [Turicibacter sp.]
MFRSGQEVIEWIHGQLKFGIRPGLERMEVALSRLDHCHLKYKTIHIGGTNGKGSTVTYLSSVLQEAGYIVGTYTSPYIEIFNERIAINGEMISDDDLAWCANIVKPIIEQINLSPIGPFTEFEIITLISFVYFKNKAVDIVIYEVGLGGRLDATNVIEPIACGITNIGHDHQLILGESLEAIAHEKLGILKPGVPVFTTVEDHQLLPIFEESCANVNTKLIKALEKYPASAVMQSSKGIQFDWESLKGVCLSMKGEHQLKNATLAYSILKYLKEKRNFNISDVSIYRGMKEAFWKGRFELLHDEPPIIIDGAHNPEGMKQLCQTVATLYPNHRKHFVVSILKDKDVFEMFESLQTVADDICFTTFKDVRAQSGEAQWQLYGQAHATFHEEYETVLDELMDELTENDCLVITGSLYFIGNVRKYLLH